MSDTARVEATLANDKQHLAWAATYRNADNEPFFELAFEHIARTLNAPRGATILDAGCGSGRHSVRLARHGFKVTGIDFSDYIVRTAEESVKDSGVADCIDFQRQDLTALSFPDESFDHVLCWGVLMHVPQVEEAIVELARVLKKGGMLVISEVNAHSLEVVAEELLRPLLGSGNVTTRKTAAGIEAWGTTSAGVLMSRRTDIGWLIDRFSKHDLELVERKTGQFTEMYKRVRSPRARRAVHALNNFCFQHVDVPALAYGNIVVLKKRTDRGT
jgi:2-polyprenyl-3-methyl-5-hydroxy-6-metoxy-1,4-benzoquinol methylase